MLFQVTLLLSTLINFDPGDKRAYTIPADDIAALTAIDDGQIRQTLPYDAGWDQPESCAHNPDQPVCVLPSGLFAVRGTEVAVRMNVERGGCAERDNARAFTAKAPALKPKGARDGRATIDERDNRKALWSWIAELKEAEFDRAENLVSAQITDSRSGLGQAQVTRLARLGGPLSSFLLYVDPDTRKLWLQSPFDDTPPEHHQAAIGTLPLIKNKACRGAERRSGDCHDYAAAMLDGIAVTNDGRHFVLWGTLSDGTSCSLEPTWVRAYPVPQFARRTMGQ